MSNYFTYRLSLDYLSAMLRKNRKKLGLSKDPSLLECMRFLYTQQPNLLESMDCLVHSEEKFFLDSGRYCIFPESVDILERLTKAKFDVALGSITTPYKTFQLAIPKGFSFKTTHIQPKGCLVNLVTAEERDTLLLKPFLKWLGHDPDVFDIQRDVEPSEMVLQLTYATETTEIGMGIARCSIPMSRLPDIMDSSSGEEFAEKLGNYPLDVRFAELPLDADEREYQFQMTRLVLAIMIYTSAVDGALEAGYPGGTRQKFLEGRYTPKYTDVALRGLKPKLGEALQSKHVPFHFRQLRDDRYYKGDYSHLKKGSRWVFVSEYFTGGKAVTLKE